jgi:Raf kinase inhibitor-like YbhB/YbcL family protein
MTTLLFCLVTLAPTEQGAGTMHLTSPAFEESGTIPKANTCDGDDSSPKLEWSGAPDNVKSFALICDDPDAPRGTWVHWVIFNLPPDSRELPAGVSADKAPAPAAKQGRNDFGNQGYGGPCPPPGKPHRYFFKLYALDTMLDLRDGASKQQLESAMKGHILAEVRLMGKYGR